MNQDMIQISIPVFNTVDRASLFVGSERIAGHIHIKLGTGFAVPGSDVVGFDG